MPYPFVHLSLEERRQLARLREQKIAIDEIAPPLGRHHPAGARRPIHKVDLRPSQRHAAQVSGLANASRSVPPGASGQRAVVKIAKTPHPSQFG